MITKSRWLPSEIDTLKLLYENHSLDELTNVFGKTKSSIVQKAMRLHLTRPRKRYDDGLTGQQRFYQRHKEELREKRKLTTEHHNELTRKNYYLHRDERLAHLKEYKRTHQDKIKKDGLLYRENNKERIKAHYNIYRENNKEKIKEKSRLYFLANREHVLLRDKIYRNSHKEQESIYHKSHSLKIKSIVITHYGNGNMACVKCGYTDIRALSIDHINGNGNNHRRRLNNTTGGGFRFYLWLINNNFPEGYQTLCMNCQFVKRMENKENKIDYERKALIENHN